MGVVIQAGAAGFGTDLSGATSVAQPPSTTTATVIQTHADAVITFAAVAGQRHRLTLLVASYSSSVAGGRLRVQDGATTVLDIDISAVGPLVCHYPPVVSPGL